MDDERENPKNIEIYPEDRKEHPFRIWDSIHAIPEILEACLKSDVVELSKQAAREIKNRKIDKVVYSGTGSSLSVSIYGNRSLAELSNILSMNMTSYEFVNYPQPYLDKRTALIGSSHSGGTQVILQAIEKAKKAGAYTVGVTEVPQSNLAKMSDVALIGLGGRGMAIPSTRSVLTEMLCVLILNLAIADERIPGAWNRWEDELKKIPQYVKDAIQVSDQYIPEIAERFKGLNAYYVIGTGPNCATVYDGALKIQEISWRPALAYQAEEAIHGPLLAVGKQNAQILIAADGNGYERVQRIARGLHLLNMPIFSISKSGADIKDYSSTFLGIPGEIPELVSPFPYLIPLFEFAYWVSVHNGQNPDSLRLKEANREEMYRVLTPIGTH